LKSQIARTEPFVERVFRQALSEAGSPETPEQKTALKVNLRKLASVITDPDLSKAYREDLLGRYEALWPVSAPVYTVGAAARELSKKRWDKKRGPPVLGASSQGKAAAQALRISPRPLAAALALAAIEDPALLADRIERVATSGFGDPQLDMVANELVALSFEADHLDPTSVRRRLAARGMNDAIFDQISRAAAMAKAAFMSPALPPERAKDLWAKAYEALMSLDALERAVDQAKQDIDRDQDFATLSRLKIERDALSRAVSAGDWAELTTH
jgi:DNA primase